MSWFSQYVGDPIKAALAKGLQAAEKLGDEELKALIGQAAKTLPAAPITATAETEFETVLQTGFDALVKSTIGEVPVAGQVLSAEVIAAGNEAIDYGVTKGGAALNALAAAAKAKLAAYAAPPATHPGS